MKVKEMKLKCCICGKEMKGVNSHNPYPVRKGSWYGETENRCCSECNSNIVVPIRIRLGSEVGDSKYRRILQRMSHEDLMNFIRENHLEIHLPTMEEIIADMEANGYTLDEKTGFFVAAS